MPVTSGLVFPYTFIGAGTNSKQEEGMGVSASIASSAVWRLRFRIPPAIPSGTFKLHTRILSSVTTGNALFTPSWILTGPGQEPSDPGLSSEAQQTVTWGATGQNLSSATVQTAGTSYVAGDICTLSGGTSSIPATIKVLTVSTGAISTITIANPGVYTALPSNPVSLTGGTGSSGKVTATWNTAGDASKYKDNKLSLIALPAPASSADENKTVVMDVTFNSASWTLAAVSVWWFSLIWE